MIFTNIFTSVIRSGNMGREVQWGRLGRQKNITTDIIERDVLEEAEEMVTDQVLRFWLCESSFVASFISEREREV